MKRYIVYGLVLLMSVPLVSCSDDDNEILEPSTEFNDNKYAVTEDATGPEADLRREFYRSTGINLLYSEILSREYVGLDAYGEEIWKEDRVDFRYNLTSMNDVAPEFTEFDSTEARRIATEYVEEYIYPHISDSSFKPFSILLVDDMLVPKYGSYGDLVDGFYYSCWRCTAMALGDVPSMDAEEKSRYASQILMNMVEEKFDKYCDDMDPFWELSGEYATERISDHDPAWDRSDMTIVYEKGYLSYYENWRGPDRDTFSDSFGNNDFDDFYSAVMSRSEDDFMEEFGMYPRIVTKYNIVKDCIRRFGYKF